MAVSSSEQQKHLSGVAVQNQQHTWAKSMISTRCAKETPARSIEGAGCCSCIRTCEVQLVVYDPLHDGTVVHEHS